MIRRTLLFAVAALLLSAAAGADTIYLSNGRTITECKVISEAGDVVVVRVKTGLLKIPRNRIDYIEKSDKPVKFKDWGEVTREKAPASSGGASSTGTSGAAKADDPDDPDHVDPELKKSALAAIRRFSSADQADRAEARDELVSMGLRITPVLVGKLQDRELKVRRNVASVLGKLAPKNAIKPLLEAMYAATPAEGKAPYWDRSYLKEVYNALRATSNKSFTYRYKRSSASTDIEAWVEWWNESWPKLPRQVGEPVLDKEAEDYEVKLKEAKQLSGKKIKFPAPAGDADAQSGTRPGQ